jgi:hypothetical protein
MKFGDALALLLSSRSCQADGAVVRYDPRDGSIERVPCDAMDDCTGRATGPCPERRHDDGVCPRAPLDLSSDR